VIAACESGTGKAIVAPRAKDNAVRILVAEDNYANRLFLTRVLEKQGHEVTGVDNGKHALDELRKRPYDLLLADVRMPGMDGVTLTCVVRDRVHPEIDPDLPIAAVTAHAMRGDRERFMSAGVNWYLPKPVSVADLMEVIGSVQDGASASDRNKDTTRKAE
jgi:CheY-like chemotaxis protein